jgi:hypothetical protein
MFSNLPVELLNNILFFEGSLHYRNGKWMNPLNLPKEIKEKISKCIYRKYDSIYILRDTVEWMVNINTHKRLALYIRKKNIGFEEQFIGDYRIITYKEGIIHCGIQTYTSMFIDEIITFTHIK